LVLLFGDVWQMLDGLDLLLAVEENVRDQVALHLLLAHLVLILVTQIQSG